MLQSKNNYLLTHLTYEVTPNLLRAVLLHRLQCAQCLIPAAHCVDAVIEAGDAHIGSTCDHDGQGAPSVGDGVIHLG